MSAPQPEDKRPEYDAQSDGYLKIRSLNQGIIIRKQEGDQVGIDDEYTISSGHPLFGKESVGPSYLVNGFTISMWVRFLDKTSTGTLFNYGNPVRNWEPHGFTLETFVMEF